jgi:PAS domain S-box-containing protein
MSSRDTTLNQSQPQRQIVVYETSDPPQDGLDSRLDATTSQTTIRSASDPVGLVDTLTESTTDCLVCYYGTETTAATEALYELLAKARPNLPRVAYLTSSEALPSAHELGFTAVHLRRETDDTAALTARVQAAINATEARGPEQTLQRLVAATVDTEGTVRQLAGGSQNTAHPDDQPALWTLPWAPSKQAVDSALEAALATPGRPATVGTAADASDLIVVTAGGSGTSTNGASPTAVDRITVVGAIATDSAGVDGPTVVDDVTATDDTELAMAEEVERYEQILDTVSDGVYALDPVGQFTYVNQGLADLTGYSRSELLGSHVSICKSESTVERAETAVREQIDRAQTDSETVSDISLELEIETADGQAIPCMDHIALLPFDDQFRGSVGVLRDVSAQQEREQTLSGLLTVTRALMAAETTRDVADLVVEAVSDVLGYDRAIVHLVDEETTRLRPEAATETVSRAVDTLSSVDVSEGPVGSVFESGSTQLYEPSEAAGAEYRTADVLMSVPLGSYGTLTVGASEGDGFEASDRQFIQLLTANAEEALNRTQRRQTLRRYEMILESVQEMMCVVDSTGRIKLLTDPLARRLDRDRSQLVGQQLSTLLTESQTDPQNGPLADLFEAQSATDITFKDQLAVGDDEPVPVSVEASQLPHVEGRPEAVVSIHDISDLISAKEAAAAERERFTYLFENLTDPVDEIRVGDNPQIKGVNSAFRTQFGEPVDIDPGLSADSHAAPIALDERLVESEIGQSLSDEFRSEDDRELKLSTNEGTKYFLYRSIPYELDDELCGFEIYTDITRLKQREIQLQVLHRLLRHNLRNDLNVIEGFAEMLKTELDNEQHQQFAAHIHTNATQLAELSETAKTIEAVAGHRSLSREPIAIGDLVRSTVESCAQSYEHAEIFLEDFPEIAISAGPHLETAIAELVENAIEHNDADSPRVSISVEVDTETATVTISDNGPGVPPEEWAVVTGDKEISQLEHGSGLGLWLVRWVTEGYGGDLTYHCLGEGSSISIQLPLADD